MLNRITTIQQVTWFLDLKKSNQLDLNPSYQRRSVWMPKDRRFFMDSVLKGYPCPAIFILKDTTDQGVTEYQVVDGKQRLETIFMFTNNEFALASDYGDKNYDGKKFRALSTSQKHIIWDYVFPVEYISKEDVNAINEVFDRVNRNSKNLQRQELRHARYDGWLINFAENESEKKLWSIIKIATTARMRRMSTVQSITELMAIVIDGDIIGFSQDGLDVITAFNDYSENDINDGDTNIDIEIFNDKFGIIKDVIVKMVDYDEEVVEYIKIMANLYILWAYINNITRDDIDSMDCNMFTDKYILFMKKVYEIYNSDGVDVEDEYANHSKYSKNLKGANTDLTQRNNRYEALSSQLDEV
jgi:Protein of unknown function DUF262